MSVDVRRIPFTRLPADLSAVVLRAGGAKEGAGRRCVTGPDLLELVNLVNKSPNIISLD